jgi:glycosyltransferase involved in cell wall biosynthesis
MESTNKLILYVNPLWRREGIHSALMNPWWGNPYGETSLFAKQLFDTYSLDTKCYAVTDDIKTAEMVLPPYPHVWFLRHDKALFNECVHTAEKACIPLLIDGTGDVEHAISVKNAYILRYGGYRFLPENRSIHIPLPSDDLLERCREGKLQVREKGKGKPIVGFAGWASLSPYQLLRTIVKELPVRARGLFDARYRACTKGVLWRRKTVRILQNSSLITFQFQNRKSFSGSSKTAEGDLLELREQMVETILWSDYALDVRGDANASTRLFEILSLGRIPVIVDTERNFPFSDKIDYTSFALIVDFRDIKKLPEKIAEFHKNISPELFEQMQRNARDAYIRYFSVDALMPLIIGELRRAKTI